ncbi:MAG: hypothetical protein Q9176_002754 [Flavoplaca citrina]
MDHIYFVAVGKATKSSGNQNSPPVRDPVSQETREVLQHFYIQVRPLARALEEENAGRIDILVDQEGRPHTVGNLERELGATNHFVIGPTISFAIPLRADDRTEFFQLDVHVCTPDLFDWQFILYSYADAWCILDLCAQNFGFSIDGTGLHLRVAEIEKTHPQDCLVHLTSDPEAMMRFLHLDANRFAYGFWTLHDLFSWVTRSRIFKRRFIKMTASGFEHRIFERPMHLVFRTEWLPQWVEVGADVDFGSQVDRTSLTREALSFFNKTDAHSDKILQYRVATIMLWKKIAKALPLKGAGLNHAMKSLMAHLQWRDGALVLIPTEHLYYDEVPSFGRDEGKTYVDEIVVPWVLAHWREAVALFNRSGSGGSTTTPLR